jgi:hypothetical protein
MTRGQDGHSNCCAGANVGEVFVVVGNASSPCSGWPGRVPYAKPRRSGSSML